jgi:hypothetical protein
MQNGRTKMMDAIHLKQFILSHFQAHAINGSIRPDRTYEIIATEPKRLKFRTRNKYGHFLQTLFADLVTCKSLKYGQFRRVDLFWGLQQKNGKSDSRNSRSKITILENESVSQSIPGPEFLSNGDLMPVDAFMSRHASKEKAS